jgi:hypothetical protein
MFGGLVTNGRLLLLLFLLAAPILALGQSTFLPVDLAFPQIAVGGDPAGLHYVTILQIVNNNSAATNGHFELLADNGSPFSVLVDGAGPQTSFEVALTPGETRQIELSLSGDIASAWLRATYTPSQALTAALIQFRSGASLRSEIGIEPSFTTLLETDLAFENDSTLNTGLAISNPSSAPGYVLARLWDPATGSYVGGTIISLSGNGHIARFVPELFPSVINIAQMRARVSLDSCSNSACVTRGGNGFLVTALRLNGDQFTTIAVVSRPTGGDLVRVLPQVAFGGPADGQNMKTVLYFTTNVAAGVTGTADIFDDDGNPLNASADGGAPSSSIPFTVASDRVSRLVLSGDSTLRGGWMRVTLPASVNLVTSAVFQTFNGTTLASEASVLEAAPVQRGLIYVKIQPNTNVGVAFANSDSSPATVTVDAFDQQGVRVASHEITLPANGHRARFVTELFPELAGLIDFTGSMAIHSSSTFSALALRLTGDKIATLPIAADGMHRPAITALRVTQTKGAPPQATFSVDVTDSDSDLSVSTASPVLAIGFIDFGGGVVGGGGISLDGTPILNQASGTLTGIVQPTNISGTAPPGYPAVLYLRVSDSLGNVSNVVAVPFTF